MADRKPHNELATLQRIGENTVSASLLNEVLLARAINHGYVEIKANVMVTLTQAGFDRIDQLLG